MRDLLVLHEPAEIMEHVHGLWKTDIFRESHEDSYGYIRHWVSRMAQVPRAFYEMSRPEIEHSNFTVLYGALHRRTYDRPAVHDLFVLHEMIHMVGLADTYDPDATWDQWARKVIHNEERTALESEVVVYFELPNLRPLSFDFPIWADQFLGRPMRPRMELYGLRRQAMSVPKNEIERRMAGYPHQNQLWAEVWRQRWAEPERAMSVPKNEIERRMAGYPHQNQMWAEVWRQRWAEPERAMRELVRDSASDRRAAAERYRRWLTEETGMTPARPYPFPDEAEAFARIFHQNRQAGIIPPDTGSGDGAAALRLMQQGG